MIEADRILEGIAKTLEETVLPAIGSGFARGQLYAVLEVLGSLQGQVFWGGMLLENEAATLAALVEEAAASVGGELGDRLRGYAATKDAATKNAATKNAATANAPMAERLREGRALVCALIEAGHADGPRQGLGEDLGAGRALAASIDSYLANDTILKAMALRPGRLAEISQG